MGIKSLMINGENLLTAAAITADASVDDYSAQAGGRLVAMTEDGTNDPPALAQFDVAVAMNNGTQAAKRACNMVDIDSSPTKLIEIVETGKQLLMRRGAPTTFRIAKNDAKYLLLSLLYLPPLIPASTHSMLCS